ncbi:MAG: holo-ACP synthase [Saccharospirillaceae bacterium]|nr:holo-ACP synthase [Pseudomonadales bacterium]NRB79082.1 holo-ACP synthase [Saccharospirillaceae bacterium]
MIAIGVDIVQVERFNKSVAQNTKFAKRILTPLELEVFTTRSDKNIDNGRRYLAKRFAAKEAVSKALGTGIAKGVSFQDIEVLNDGLGAPFVSLFNKALSIYKQKNAQQILISISDEKDFVIAYVTLC